MEPFDVLNMGNILHFHSKHSNHHLFLLFLFQGPFKNLPIIGFTVLKTTGWNSGFQRKNWFWKICTKSWYIAKNVSKFRFQAKCQNFLTFLPISLDRMRIFPNQFLPWNLWFKAVVLSTMNLLRDPEIWQITRRTTGAWGCDFLTGLE